MERASTDSALYPQKVDKDTTSMGVGCREEAGRVIFVYDNQMDVTKSKIPKGMLGAQKVAVRNMLCTNPSLKPLLQLVGMEYAYYDSSHVFIGAITNRIEDCKDIGVSLPLAQKSTKTEAPAKRQADLLHQAKAGNASKSLGKFYCSVVSGSAFSTIRSDGAGMRWRIGCMPSGLYAVRPLRFRKADVLRAM